MNEEINAILIHEKDNVVTTKGYLSLYSRPASFGGESAIIRRRLKI